MPYLFLKIVLAVYVCMVCLMTLHLFGHKKNVAKLLFVNNLTSHFVVILCILAVLQKEYSLLDMSMMYVLLSPLVAICVLFYKKYFIDDADSAPRASGVALGKASSGSSSRRSSGVSSLRTKSRAGSGRSKRVRKSSSKKR